MADALCQGKDSDGKVAPMGATTDSFGNPAMKSVAERPIDYAGTVTPFENDNVVDARVTPNTQPTAGARVVTIAFLDKGSAVATELYVVFNALNDADANTKLGLAGSRHVIIIGERRTWVFPAGGECVRIDYESDDAAPVGGANKVTGEYVI